MKTLPSRMCLGCRRARPQRDMVRLIRRSNGTVVVDGENRAAGRGAYVCLDAGCLERGLTRSRLGHAFRRPSEAVPDLVAAVRASGRRNTPALPRTTMCEAGARGIDDVDVIAVRS